MNPEQFDASFPTPLLNVCRTWLHTGWVDLGSAMGADGASPPLFRTFGEFVACVAAKPAGWEFTPIAELWAQPARRFGGSVRDVLREWLGVAAPWLLETAVEAADWETYTQALAAKEAGLRRLESGGREQLVEALTSLVETEMAGLTLIDAFRRRRHEVGFASWAQHNARLLQDADRVQASSTRQPLFLSLSKVEDEDDEPVAAVEWVGGLKDPDLKTWRSVAAGMLYRFVRRARNRGNDLAEAADHSSGGDLERVAAFLNAHDHEKILSKGDIAFVWQWERRHGTEPGDGVECLAAICEQLRAHAPKLKSIVIALSPERFAPRCAGEPPLITEARLADLDRLQAYVSTLGPRLGLDVYLTASDQSDVAREPDVVIT